MRLTLLILAGLIAAAAAAIVIAQRPETRPIEIAASTPLIAATFRTVLRDPPIFAAHRATRAAREAFIGALPADPGFARRHRIQDPTAPLEAALAERLAERYGGVVAAAPIDLRGQRKAAPILPAPGEIAVEIRPTRWGVWYYPDALDRYRVYVHVRGDVIGGAAGEAIGRHDCARADPWAPETSPSLDDLLADGAALLNRRLKRMAEECAAEIAARVL